MSQPSRASSITSRTGAYNPWKLGGLNIVELGRRIWRESQQDELLGRAAQLSYYALLALFPAPQGPGTGDEYGGIRRVTGRLLRRIRYYIAQQCFSATASIPIML